jgi:hypothetical protein
MNNWAFDDCFRAVEVSRQVEQESENKKIKKIISGSPKINKQMQTEIVEELEICIVSKTVLDFLMVELDKSIIQQVGVAVYARHDGQDNGGSPHGLNLVPNNAIFLSSFIANDFKMSLRIDCFRAVLTTCLESLSNGKNFFRCDSIKFPECILCSLLELSKSSRFICFVVDKQEVQVPASRFIAGDRKIRISKAQRKALKSGTKEVKSPTEISTSKCSTASLVASQQSSPFDETFKSLYRESGLIFKIVKIESIIYLEIFSSADRCHSFLEALDNFDRVI